VKTHEILKHGIENVVIAKVIAFCSTSSLIIVTKQGDGVLRAINKIWELNCTKHTKINSRRAKSLSTLV
jgi:hypothetical protein